MNGIHIDDADPDIRVASFFWIVTATILSFLCMLHLGVQLGFLPGLHQSTLVFPGALLISLTIGIRLSLRAGYNGWHAAKASLTLLAILSCAFLLAASLFDMSWDGLWYHQTAVYQMADGWNPLTDPLRSFTPHLQDWVRHYAKGPWYIALAVYKTTGNIELGKISPLLTLAAMFCAVFAVSLDLGMRRLSALLIAILVSLNPVVIFELASYLVDGIMIALLACHIAAMIRWIHCRDPVILSIALMSAILCINAKFTGLVYLCFYIAAGGIYVVFRKRDLIKRYLSLQLAAVVLGTVVFGYNPYVTNTIHRGTPFYPILGSTSWPSHAEMGEDAIETYETPRNMTGRNRFVRLGYAMFGRPAAYPYPRENAILMWPFQVGPDDFAMYYFHDVRISGFGPLFSGALILSVLLLGAALARPGSPRLMIVLIWGASALSLLVSIHTWWARYGPQLWWLPVVSILAALVVSDRKYIRIAAGGLAGLLLVNVVIIEAVHFNWEVRATRTTHEQLAMLVDMGEVNIDFKYFSEPFGRRLSNAGVTYREVPLGSLDTVPHMELMSVSHGYWGAVLMRLPERETTSE